VTHRRVLVDSLADRIAQGAEPIVALRLSWRGTLDRVVGPRHADRVVNPPPRCCECGRLLLILGPPPPTLELKRASCDVCEGEAQALLVEVAAARLARERRQFRGRGLLSPRDRRAAERTAGDVEG
jgi:hypothetical protein